MLPLLACMLTLAQAPVPAPPPNPNAPPTPGTATLRGHVFAADTGQPLRRAQVRITANEIRENRMATTDAEGRYEFKEVRAGRYQIFANKGSYVSLGYGQPRPMAVPKPITILDNQTVEKMDFMLPRGSIVSGRILDEFGEPIPDVQVAAQQYQTIQGQRRLVPSGRQTQTNDIGEFRLFGIPPGQYYLTATWRNNNNNPLNLDDRTAYAPMYFPGTDNPAQAQRLTLAIGQELSDLVMALKPIKATRVNGTVTTADGRPLTGMVMAMTTGGFGFNTTGNGQIRPDGTFVINGLAPGEYMLRAQSFGPNGPDGETATMKITATGDDIADVRLVGVKPSSVVGRVFVDPAAAAALPASLQLMTMPIDPSEMSFNIASGRMSDDGSFEMRGQVGRMRVSVMSPGWTAADRAAEQHRRHRRRIRDQAEREHQWSRGRDHEPAIAALRPGHQRPRRDAKRLHSDRVFAGQGPLEDPEPLSGHGPPRPGRPIHDPQSAAGRLLHRRARQDRPRSDQRSGISRRGAGQGDRDHAARGGSEDGGPEIAELRVQSSD